MKQKIFWQIDENAQKLIELGKMIWNHPEPGYYEFKTAARIKEIFDSIALPSQTGLARTGIRADLSMKRPGPHIAILGELDALIMPEHPKRIRYINQPTPVDTTCSSLHLQELRSDLAEYRK